MPVDLTAAPFGKTSAAHVQLLNNIQCNILHPALREHAIFLFFGFSDLTNAKEFIRKIRGFVKSAKDQFDLNIPREDCGVKVPSKKVLGAFCLSADGYRALGLDPKVFKETDRTFNRGMKDQSGGGIFGTNNKDPKVSTWESGFQKPIHAYLMLTSDPDDFEVGENSRLKDAVRQVTGYAALHGVSIVVEQEGRVIREGGDVCGEPLEHFGYRDGISQPIFLADYMPIQNEMTQWDPSADLSLVLAPDPFANHVPDSFGSFVVFRKLEQDVNNFNIAVENLAQQLGINQELAGAMVVGRFKDGTPLTLSGVPNSTTPKNDFEYDNTDEDGDKCPRHSHIRKANPRGNTPFTSLKNEKTRRIARRGIPYHPSVNSKGLGLLFVCYQSDIAAQFEFIQRTWIDNANFPRNLVLPSTGDDPLIGQDKTQSAKQKWPKSYNNSDRKDINFQSFVTLKGGEYFFAPSMPFLNSL